MARGVGEFAACALGLTVTPLRTQSGVQHCVTHPVRVVGGSTARIEQCWVKNCGRPFGQDTEGSIKVM